jgi:hypothetical protein
MQYIHTLYAILPAYSIEEIHVCMAKYPALFSNCNILTIYIRETWQTQVRNTGIDDVIL